MDRAGIGAGIRRGDRRARARRRRAPHQGARRRRPRAMAAPRAPHQGHARHLRERSRGHDLAGGPARGRHTQEPAHQIQRESHLCKYSHGSFVATHKLRPSTHGRRV